MKLDRRNLLAGGAALATVPHLGREAFAQTRAETLRYVTGAAVNTLDPTMPGSTREAFGISVNVYDRLSPSAASSATATGSSTSTTSAASSPRRSTSARMA